MNPEWKAKWLEALKSGEYKKAKKRLRNRNGGMCCLGVLCDIVDNSKWDKLMYGFEEHSLPYSIRQEVDLYDEEEIISLNDQHTGWAKVISYIETEL